MAILYSKILWYTLNLEPVTHDISMRTLERYIELFEKDELARAIMSDVTVRLVELLEINIDASVNPKIISPDWPRRGRETCALAKPVMDRAGSSTAISVNGIVRKTRELIAVAILMSSGPPIF